MPGCTCCGRPWAPEELDANLWCRGCAALNETPSPKPSPPRRWQNCVACGEPSQSRWCSDACWRLEDGGPYE